MRTVLFLFTIFKITFFSSPFLIHLFVFKKCLPIKEQKKITLRQVENLSPSTSWKKLPQNGSPVNILAVLAAGFGVS